MTRVQPGAVVPTIMAWLDNQPQVGPAPLVFLDTLGKVMPPKGMGETDYMRDYRVAGQLKAVADSWPGMALVALHVAFDVGAGRDHRVTGLFGELQGFLGQCRRSRGRAAADPPPVRAVPG